MLTFCRYIRLLILIMAYLTATTSVYGVPSLPQSELSWKNISIEGKNITVFTIYIDSHGIAWIGSNNGLYFYDGLTARAVNRDQMLGYQVYSILEDGDWLYLGSNNGLLRYNYESGQIEPIPVPSPKEIRTLLRVDSTIWIGSLEGIHTFDLQTQQIANLSQGLPHRSVYSLLRDSRGILYVGTYNGLARWNSSKDQFQRVASAPVDLGRHNMFVNCMLESDDNTSIYIGTEGALYLYTPSIEKWEKVPGLKGKNIKSLAANKMGHLLVGTHDGVVYYDYTTMRNLRHDSRYDQTISDNEIWYIGSDHEDNIWIGHQRGFSIASNSSTFRNVQIASLANSGEGNEFHVIYRDSGGNLWLGGSNGILRLSDDRPLQWFNHTDYPRSLSHNRVRGITEDLEGRVWFATDGGIDRFVPEANDFDVFHIVDHDGEHTSNWVYALRDAGDSLWVGSYLGGIHLIDKRSLWGRGGTVEASQSLNADFSNLRGGKCRLRNDLVNNIVYDCKDRLWVLLYRDSTVTRIDKDGEIHRFDVKRLTGENPTHLIADDSDRVWCGFNGGVVVLTDNGNNEPIRLPKTDNSSIITAIGNVGQDIWLSASNNIWKIDGESFQISLLPIPGKPYLSIYEDPVTGLVYLGGTDEITVVTPESLDSKLNSHKIQVLLNSPMTFPQVNATFSEDCPVIIPYEGALNLVVSNLDYSPESVQRYVYCLVKSGGDSINDWVILPEGVNTIHLSDISMGNYTLLVRNLGDFDVPLSIPLKVEGPWTLSWWAFLLYALIAVGIIVGLVMDMRRRNRRLLLEEEKKKAMESVEKKLTFLSNVSHDFKTPLSMILGPASLLKEQAKDPEEKRNLEAIYQNAVRLNNLIHRAIELNHIDEDAENMVILSTFDAVGFCRDIFDTFKENNPNKQFVFHSSVKRVVIEADAVKFESIITNLLSNACKYSDEGATISIGVHTNGSRVEIVVSDDGLGIASDDQQLVFQRMYRAKSTSSVAEGTGIGLYLIKKYLELMNGNIELYSQKGQGTAFVVTLPINETVLANEEETDEAASDSKKPRILIVEDNSQISAFIRGLLKADFTCCTADNGKAGLSLASSFTPDLIILDEMMPVMSGIEMARQLKKNPRLATVPIIMLTAKDDNHTENESVRLGIDAFMSKPFEPSLLINRINHLIVSRAALKQSVRIEKLTEPRPIEAESMTEKQLAKIVKLIEENVADPDLNVNQLCEKSGIPNKQLYRLIKKYMGIGPLDYIRRVRLQKAAMLLSQHRFTVSEVSYMVGFKTPSYFAKCFQQQYGVSPSQYRSPDESPSTLTPME